MAAASGPVENSSGKTEELNEFVPPEPPRQRQTSSNDEGKNEVEFKLPDPNVSLIDRKKTSVVPANTPSESGSKPKKQTSERSPAETLKQTQVSIPYKEPIWGGVPPESEKYSFDVLKNGTVIDSVELGQKPWLVFGRLPSCDVCMEHPSLSRHHAVVQYRETAEDGNECGWYLYDLDSTHGTWVNKEKIKPKVYRRLHVGHVLKFGGSSRLYILQGPETDQEPESELSITELKQQTARLKRETELLKQAEREEEEEMERQRQKILELRGCSWGMGEDAIEEDEENPTATSVTGLVPQHEHLYKDDPKKALKGFYEREGCDLPDYQFTEVGFGKHKCVVELPVDGPNGEVLIAEATVSGKKKDAVVACAFEACRLLDMHGMLHASKHESRKRKAKNWEDNDFYDSDEDTFLDRTGTIEKKRIFRMKKSGKEEQAETYDSLVPKHEEVQKRIAEIEFKLEQAKAQADAMASEEDDALDAYMTAIKAGVMDTKTRLSLKRELLSLRTEEQRLRRLVNLARPADMPELKKLESGLKKPIASATGTGNEKKKTTASSGIASGMRKIGVAKAPKTPLPLPVVDPVQSREDNFQEEEEEEDEDGDTPVDKTVKPATSATSAASRLTHDDSASQSSTSKKSNSITPSCASETVEKEEDSRQKPSVLASIKELASKTVPLKGAEKDRDSVVKGPALPLSATAARKQEEENLSSVNTEPAPVKKKKKTAPPRKPKKVDYDDSDPNYAMWMPPQGQSGDGRTSLNDKLGY
ncbi:kanadaptin-like [Babylonia areolata]|uniref:kanadaptin-like n=1 Tax=Babylonia areolata TaxID=304850 RepID=UPI003FD53762